ncbi:hypothetical protein [Humisphaera borealis]|uniref:Uncharacterized protein n=1 Tax=Humisphaera borealis TaxID=2807512 RepID=A0A7M2WUT8_9BACT|nr:hypothetical protein [Humisphaera borealis]QOV88561.1 hypothetical protein IPV69_20290 [Humisphaera borealis]
MHPRSLGLAVFFAVISGCDDGKSVAAAPDAKPPVAAAPAAVATATVAVPGTASGRITRPDGKPIGIDGVKYKMVVNGNAGSGNAIAYNPKPNPDGTWSTKLAEGIYHEPRGTMSVKFDGGLYTYDLYPTAEPGDTESAKGLAADFQWRISGPIKQYEDKADPSNATHWYGASCRLNWNPIYGIGEGKQGVHTVVDKTKFVFTAKPQGKLIDGSDGKPLTWTLEWGASDFKPSLLHDLPPAVGGWRVSGTEITPDGKQRPLTIRLSGVSDKFLAEVDVKVEADQYGGPIVGPILIFTRAAP